MLLWDLFNSELIHDQEYKETVTTWIGLTENPFNYSNGTDANKRVTYIPLTELTVYVVTIAIIGMVANSIILWALLTHARKGTTNTLIANQTIADLCSCTVLFLTYTLKLPRFYLTGNLGIMLCKFIFIDTLVWVGLIASVTCLVLLTLERYFKIVYPMVHLKHFRPWMIKAAIVVTWLNGILRNVQLFTTARLHGGSCTDGGQWDTSAARIIYGTAIFTWDFVIPMVVFTYCYARILNVVRSTMSVASDKTDQSNTGFQDKATRSRNNATRTLVIVSVTFALCWAPLEINRLLMYSGTIDFKINAYYACVGIAFFNATINPFIYAAKYEPVRKILGRKFGFRSRNTTVAPVTTTGSTE